VRSGRSQHTGTLHTCVCVEGGVMMVGGRTVWAGWREMSVWNGGHVGEVRCSDGRVSALLDE